MKAIHSHRHLRTSVCGFTLVELLVVIGIIALLISILLPALNRARQQANMVKCAATLQQYMTAVQTRAAERKGWIPLVGRVNFGAGSPWANIPAGVGDSNRLRYDYTRWPDGFESVLPLPIAIGKYMGQKSLDYDAGFAMHQMLTDHNSGLAQINACPSVGRTEDGAGPSYSRILFQYDSGGGGWFWQNNLDFVFNDAVTGYQAESKYASRTYNGNLARVKQPSVVMFMGDGLPSEIAMHTMSPMPTSIGAVTAGDALEGNGKAVGKNSFDLKRHRGRMNIAFCDGHVASIAITPGEMSQVFLLTK